MHRLRSRQDSMAGGLAQLVERLLCKQDVSGSSPLTSIQQPTTQGEIKLLVWETEAWREP